MHASEHLKEGKKKNEHARVQQLGADRWSQVAAQPPPNPPVLVHIDVKLSGIPGGTTSRVQPYTVASDCSYNFII